MLNHGVHHYNRKFKTTENDTQIPSIAKTGFAFGPLSEQFKFTHEATLS